MKHNTVKRLTHVSFHLIPKLVIRWPSDKGSVYLFVCVSALTRFAFFLLLPHSPFPFPRSIKDGEGMQEERKEEAGALLFDLHW